MHGVDQGTAGALVSHPCDVSKHMRPIEMQANAMESAGGIEMPVNGIAVECNKDNVPESCRDDDQLRVRFEASDGFPINKDVVL